MRRSIIIMAFLVMMTTPLATAQERLQGDILEDKNAHWQITAGKIIYMENEKLYIAEGGVVITRNGQVLSGEKAVYNIETGIAQITGDVKLTSNGSYLTGEMGIFDLNSHTGQIRKGKIFLKENNFYVNGTAMIRLSQDTYIVKDCRLTTCDGDTPDWSITGSEVKVTVEGHGVVKDAAFRIRDIPVLYLPYGAFPVKKKRQTGLLIPRVGYSDSNGMDTELPFFWAISDQMDATFYERYMTERGFMQGVEFRYLGENDSKGTFMLDILSDQKEVKDLTDQGQAELSPFPRTNKTRYWLRNRMDQQLPMDVQMRLDTDFVSDQDYLKEFRGGLYGSDARPAMDKEHGRGFQDIYSPTRRSALRLSRDREDYSLQAGSSYYEQPENPPNDETAQPLGSAHFQVLPRPLGGAPLFLKFASDYDNIWRDVGVRGNRLAFAPEVTMPMWHGPYLGFEPSVVYARDSQWLNNDPQGIDQQSRDAYQAQARVHTLLERVFPFDWGGATRLKHKFLPSLTYRYRSYKDKDRFKPWFEPIDVTGDTSSVILSLDNFLDARLENDKGETTYAQWASLSLIQPYDIHEARRDEEPLRKKEPFEPLAGLLTLDLIPHLVFDGEAHWSHAEDRISFTDLSLELSVDRAGGRADTFGIDYQYARGDTESLNYYMNIHLISRFSIGTVLRKDLSVGHTFETGYWVDYQAQCWGLRLTAANLDGVSSIVVVFRLVGLGAI